MRPQPIFDNLDLWIQILFILHLGVVHPLNFIFEAFAGDHLVHLVLNVIHYFFDFFVQVRLENQPINFGL